MIRRQGTTSTLGWTILVALLAGGTVVSVGCGIKTNIGSGLEDDDDTSTDGDDDASGDDDSGSGDDDASQSGDDDSSGDDDASEPGDDDDVSPPPTDGGCEAGDENCIDVEGDQRPFGAITTAVFSLSDDGAGSYSPLIVQADYGWSCQELQNRPPTGTRIPYTPDESTVVGVSNLLLGAYDATIGGMIGSTETGIYQVVTSPRKVSEDGKLISLASVYFMNNDGYAVFDNATGGSVTIDTYEIDGAIEGDFDLELESGSSASGRFVLERCDFPPYDGGQGNPF